MGGAKPRARGPRPTSREEEEPKAGGQEPPRPEPLPPGIKPRGRRRREQKRVIEYISNRGSPPKRALKHQQTTPPPPPASGQVCRHDRQRNGEGARVVGKRGHSTPEAPHTPAVGHRGMARLPRKQNRAPALRGPQHRVRAHASPPAGAGRMVENREKQSAVVRTALSGTQGVGGSAADHRLFGGVSASLAERTTVTPG
jgi:hypothetical protein